MKKFICSNGNGNGHGYMFNANDELYPINIDSDREIKVGGAIEFHFDSNVVQICCGGNHSLFLTKYGNVYGSGNNSDKQLTNKYDESKSCNIQKIIDTGNIVKIGCSWSASFVLNNNHVLKSFGEDLIGKENDLDGFRVIHDLKVKHFDCGEKQFGMITIYGKLYMNGMHQSRQQMDFSPIILDVKCGRLHTIARIHQNQFYSFGYNNPSNLLLHNPGKCGKRPPKLISNEYIMQETKSKQNILDLIPSRRYTYIIQQNN